MRVEIIDDSCFCHVIDTDDIDLVGRWFARKAELLMSANARIGDCRLRVWPSNEAEAKTIGQHESKLTQDGILELTAMLLNVSAELGVLEAGNGRNLRA